MCGDISTCGIPEEGIFHVFPRFLLLLHVASLDFWEDAGDLLRVSSEGLELLLLSFHFPDKFGRAGDVMKDGNVFP